MKGSPQRACCPPCQKSAIYWNFIWSVSGTTGPHWRICWPAACKAQKCS